jgi:hypothetical protein
MSRLTEHLSNTNKSYFGHFRGALLTSIECFVAGLAALLHGLLPFILETTASDKIREIYKRQNL